MNTTTKWKKLIVRYQPWYNWKKITSLTENTDFFDKQWLHDLNHMNLIAPRKTICVEFFFVSPQSSHFYFIFSFAFISLKIPFVMDLGDTSFLFGIKEPVIFTRIWYFFNGTHSRVNFDWSLGLSFCHPCCILIRFVVHYSP